MFAFVCLFLLLLFFFIKTILVESRFLNLYSVLRLYSEFLLFSFLLKSVGRFLLVKHFAYASTVRELSDCLCYC